MATAEKLTGLRKAAILLICLGEESAARISRRSKQRSTATSFVGKETGGCPPVSVILHPP